ncbi:VOC family protein, partial [candidate division KSB1 bacterium]|nr:VOC family protein [candidate division KSB1 bacterium]
MDHVNIAVESLVAAKNHYSDILGFSIKPGRLHKNGLLNAFTKFKDGSLLE